MTVDFSLPDEFLKYYGGSPEQLAQLNRILLAIELYLDGRVSIGKAAELSGLPFDQFHQELTNRKIKRRGDPQSIEALKDELRSAEAHLE